MYLNTFRRFHPNQINPRVIATEIEFKSIARNQTFKHLFAQKVENANVIDALRFDSHHAMGWIGIDRNTVVPVFRNSRAILNDVGELLAPVRVLIH